MKIENIIAPTIAQPAGAKATGALTSVQRAVAKLEALQNAPQIQETPVKNPTQVSPEEYRALRAVPSENVGQTDKNETVSSEAQADTKASEEPLSSQYAILARKEKAIRLRDQQLKQREAALRAQEEASRAPTKTETSAFDPNKYVDKERIMKDPIRALLDMGLTYDQLTEAAINGPSQENLSVQNELKALREELKALKGETESTKKTFEESQTIQRQQAERQIASDVSRLVQSDPNFETVKLTNSVSDVVELITKTFDKDGILLSVEEAAQEVEDYLLEEALKLTKINKVQSRLASKLAQAAPKQTTSQPQQSQMKTLTSQVSGSRPLSARERALLAFENKLNK